MAGKADKTGCYKCHKNTFKRNNSIFVKCITEKVKYNLEAKPILVELLGNHKVFNNICNYEEKALTRLLMTILFGKKYHDSKKKKGIFFE